MKILHGNPIASGIVKGTVCLYLGRVDSDLPHYLIENTDVKTEINRFDTALSKAKSEMTQMVHVSKELKDKKAEDIFGVHLLMLEDPRLKEKVERLISEKLINAEHAVSDVFGEYISKYETQSGHFKELAHDFMDTRDRILGAFREKTGGFKCPVGEAQPVIVAAKLLTPSMILNMNKDHVLGFVAEEGGITSHATILARSFSVPMVFGINVEKELDCGCQIFLDGSKGKVILDPDQKTTEYYDKKIQSINEKKNLCVKKRNVSAQTKLGQRISLKLNISTPEDLNTLHEIPHDGIGLLRTEFLFAKRDSAPTEEEQLKMYDHIFNHIPDRPITVRLLDIGTDKLPPFLIVPENVNPDLELRGAIAAEVFEYLYITQLKSILRANENGNVRILFPMVSDVGDILTFKRIVAKSKDLLKKERSDFKHNPIKIGAMIETPGAVMMIKEILNEVDFVNIGSNDLLQYTLAASRGNMIAEKRYHILHPAVLKFIEITAREGKKAKKEVCLCGEIAAFEEFYPLLLGAGLTSFSVAVTKFEDIKCQIMHQVGLREKKDLKEFYNTKTKEEADSFFLKYI
ncbi:MAG: phosphoenolpyruvate--protein phosphotransferase [Elusimicrobia bacterium]|nr:phosphoenolpyruvate--protein phosphotransferase [Elusimicrobiota bacterium]